MRFTHLLSQDCKDFIANFAEVTKDEKIRDVLRRSTEKSDTDALYNSIIHEGQDEEVDNVISVLQEALIKKPVMAARIAGSHGMELARAAFAGMLKTRDLGSKFQELSDTLAFADTEDSSEKI